MPERVPTREGAPRHADVAPHSAGRRGPHLVSGPMTGVLLAGLAAALVAVSIAAISIGSVNLPAWTVWRVVAAHLTGGSSGDPLHDQAIWELRTPRVLVAAIVGAGLRPAGVALQALVRNPLADPYVLGISAGASLGAVLVVSFGAAALGRLGVTGAAFCTALLSVLAVYALAQRGGRLLDLRLVLAGVTAEIEGTPIVSGIDLVAEPGTFTGLIGPNGSGKSTLLRTVYRSLRPSAGVVSLDGDDLWRMRARRAARRRAVVTQHGDLAAEFSAAEVVAMGRAPHKGVLDRENAADRTVVAESLDRVGLAHAAGRLFSTLSGGERQRVLVARRWRSGRRC